LLHGRWFIIVAFADLLYHWFIVQEQFGCNLTSSVVPAVKWHERRPKSSTFSAAFVPMVSLFGDANALAHRRQQTEGA
jgi:hypothetical protein